MPRPKAPKATPRNVLTRFNSLLAELDRLRDELPADSEDWYVATNARESVEHGLTILARGTGERL